MITKSKKDVTGNVKSATRALDIFELLADFPNGLSLTDIGKSLNVPLSSMHGLINTLLDRGFLIRIEGTMLYRLGPGIVKVAASYRAQADLVSIADPIMERIRHITSETTSLAVLQGNMIVFIHKRPAEGVVQVVNPVGTRRFAHSTGSGKIMLAYLSSEEIDNLYLDEELPVFTPNTIKTKTALLSALAEAREKQYAYDNEESNTGVWAVAGCIRNEEGRPVAAISVVAPLFHIQAKDYMNWYTYIRDGAIEASAPLKFKL
jgi:IclR family transcriptional regulator, acetate operon repressor